MFIDYNKTIQVAYSPIEMKAFIDYEALKTFGWDILFSCERLKTSPKGRLIFDFKSHFKDFFLCARLALLAFPRSSYCEVYHDAFVNKYCLKCNCLHFMLCFPIC